MPYIECCNQRRICNAYKLENLSGLVFNYAYYLEACPVCSHSILLIRRFFFDGSVSEVRKINEKARKLFAKIQPSIICKYTQSPSLGASSYFLRYNEFGVIKKCYSNLSTLQIGLFENLDLPNIPEKLPVPARIRQNAENEDFQGKSCCSCI